MHIDLFMISISGKKNSSDICKSIFISQIYVLYLNTCIVEDLINMANKKNKSSRYLYRCDEDNFGNKECDILL